MGITVSTGEDGPEALFRECVLGPNADVDLTWLREVPGLKKVTFSGVNFHDVKYGREELSPLFGGREEPVLKGCRLCDSLIDGSEGCPDVCPDELAHRCVMLT